jgi:hypothetical protein
MMGMGCRGSLRGNCCHSPGLANLRFGDSKKKKKERKKGENIKVERITVIIIVFFLYGMHKE